MNTTGNNETIQQGLYYEWMNNLSMYLQQLRHLDEQVDKKAYNRVSLDTAIELDALKELINVQQLIIEELASEVQHRYNQLANAEQSQKGVISFNEVLRNNQLREKIRKAEHSVFYLKYNVTKLLSIAS